MHSGQEFEGMDWALGQYKEPLQQGTHDRDIILEIVIIPL